MKQDTIDFVNNTFAEIWQPSMQLRFILKAVTSNKKTLQQLYISNLGNKEWKEVPIETI